MKSLPQKLKLRVRREDTSVFEGCWTYLGCGQNRIVFSYADGALVCKLHPHKPVLESQNEEEWCIFQSNHALRRLLLPECYGLATCKIGDQDYEVLFLERIAFTIEKAFWRLQEQAPNRRTVALAAQLAFLPMEHACELAGPKHQILLMDWHTQNIAVTDESPPKVKLLDWVNHVFAPETAEGKRPLG